MRNFWIALASGVAAAALLAGAWYGAPYAGLRLDETTLVATAAVLAFAASTAAFALVALVRPDRKKISRSTSLGDLPASEFLHPIRASGTVEIVALPDVPVEHMLIRHRRLFDRPSDEIDETILVTVKKGKRGALHNPIVLKGLFAKLPFRNFLHVLLVNEHDEFVGYIPGPRARIDFTGASAETQIRKYIVDMLNDPSQSFLLRDIGGLAKDDTIRDTDTVANAAARAWGGLIRGLVVLKHGRNRKPLGVIFAEDLYRLAAYGA